MGRKHCGKRRNCSLRAISPFPHSVFKRLVLQTRKNQGLFGKGLNYIEPQKKRRNFNNSIRYGKQSLYFFSLNYKFLLQHKALVIIRKS